MPPLLFCFMPLIVLATLTEIALTAYGIKEGKAAQHVSDPADLM